MSGQGWLQLGELGLAFGLSAVVGLERELRQKNAGLRTYTLVGVSAALFMLVSKYGFMDVLTSGRVVVDPSRVAAQIVSGIGFIGGGVIFMRRNVVRGLTTAATVWLTAALGMACGAGLPILAVATTLIHFVVMLVFPKLADYLSRERSSSTRLRIAYQDRRNVLREILIACTELRFAVSGFEIEKGTDGGHGADEIDDLPDREGLEPKLTSNGLVVLSINVRGKRTISALLARLHDISGVRGVATIEETNEMA